MDWIALVLWTILIFIVGYGVGHHDGRIKENRRPLYGKTK